MVTFRTNTILKTALAPNMKCTSMFLTLTYLILVIDNYGVIVYNFQNLKDPIGVLALGGFRYTVTCNHSGSVSVTEKGPTRNVTNIFKLSRIWLLTNFDDIIIKLKMSLEKLPPVAFKNTIEKLEIGQRMYHHRKRLYDLAAKKSKQGQS